ncbi:hypothetical protein D9M69_529000 [compost metagenome]
MADLQVDARRFAAQRTDQSRQDNGGAVVGHRQTEGALGGRGIEGVRRQQRLHLGQGCGQRYHEFQRSRSLHKTGTGAHQQRIAEQVTQARQRMADRWLAQVQTLGRPGHVLLAEQGVEDHQQVEVDTAKIIHLLHVLDNKTEFKSA